MNAQALKLLIEIAGRDTGGLKAVTEQNKALATLGQTGAVVGKALLAAGAVAGGALAAGLGASVNAARGFEQTMSAVNAVSGATAEEMKQLSGLALQLGKDTSFSASSAAQGIEELVKGGLTIPDIMSGAAKATLDLAAAGGVELPIAAEIAANALAMFNLKGADMAMVADQIAGAANASSLSVTDFKFSLAAAGSVLAGAGQSFEQTATAIALMGQAGIKGSDAGTSLKSMFNNLIPTTDKATAAMQAVGLWTQSAGSAFVNANGSFKDASEIAALLQQKLGHLSEAQRSVALETIFGSDGMRAAIVLTKAGAEGYDRMADAMGKVTAASVGAEKLNNLNGSLEQLKGSLETAAITLGVALLPMLRGLVDGATRAVNAAIPLIETWGPKLVAAFDDLRGTMQPLIDVFPDLLTAGQQAIAFFMTGAGDIEVFRGVLNRLIGPEGAQQVITVFTNVAGFFQTTILPMLQGQSETWGKVFSGDLPGALTAFMTSMGAFTTDLLGRLAEWGKQLLAWVAPMIPPMLVEANKLFVQLLGWITANGPPLLEKFLSEWVPQAIKWLLEANKQIIPYLLEFAGAIKTWLEGPGGQALGQMFLEFGKAAVVGMVKGLWELSKWSNDELIRLLGGVVDAAKDWAGKNLPALGSAIVAGIQAGIAGAWEGFRNYLAGQLSNLVEFSKRQLRISSPSQVFADEVGRPIVDGILAGIQDGQPQLLAGMLAMMEAIREQVVPAIDAITEAAERSKEAVGAWLEAFQESPLTQVADQAEAATWVIEGLTEAMEDLADAINAVPSLPGGGGDGGGGGIGDVPGWHPPGPGPIPGLPFNSTGVGAPVINLTVNGSVLTERDLIDAIYAGLVRKGLSQGGLSFSGALT